MTSTAITIVADKPTAPAVQSMMMRPIASPREVLAVIDETRALVREALRSGTDYGVIPGTDRDKSKAPKQTLLKPGAEKIVFAFGCRTDYDIIDSEIDHDREFRVPSEWVEAQQPDKKTQEAMKLARTGRNRKVNDDWQWQEKGAGVQTSYGLYRYVVRCTITRHDGVVVGSGLGTCSSMESKYLSRPRECDNTILKMANKRALVAAVLGTFGLSEAFTQDVGDDEDDEDVRVSERAAVPPPAKPADTPEVREFAELGRIIGAALNALGIQGDDAKTHYVETTLHGVDEDSIRTPLMKRRVLAAALAKDVAMNERDKAKPAQAALIDDDTDKRGGAL